MSARAFGAAAIVRALLDDGPGDTVQSSTITGLTTPLGQSIVVTVFPDPVSSAEHQDMRLEIAEVNRGDADADLGVVVAPTGLAGIDRAAPEAWNVTLTLPTLLRLLGQDHTTQEGTPS
ncbi:hypothetical protein [Leucobacter tenebrionis]|uniref:hypothetical protein n=1 Tax=Leucobacter tenebrionis TaxID=2873270 RepID=UPI001CA621D3|nr:hypothetical protein [Leucobacter tenebrionis]QZY52899.1 hypothetical protein KVY00_05550 [Leucobacter tenebrionis]